MIDDIPTWAVYKCRLCGAVFTLEWSGKEPNILKRFLIEEGRDLVSGIDHQDVIDAEPSKPVIHHNCENNMVMGLADYVGVSRRRITPRTEKARLSARKVRR